MIVSTASQAFTQTELCRLIRQSINHPAQVIAEKVKRSFSSAQCIATPHCCGPSWSGHPECYVIQNRTVRDAWTEIRETTDCIPKAADEALHEFIENHTDPTYILTQPIYDHYAAVVAIAQTESDSIPEPYRQVLSEIAESAGQDIVVFSAVDASNARWISSSNDLTALLRPGTWGYSNPAITHNELIVVNVIEANLLFELDRCERDLGTRVGFNADAREDFLRFAHDPGTRWTGNFRDFGSSIRRLCTLAPRGRITRNMVADEITTLSAAWRDTTSDDDKRVVLEALGEKAGEIDPFDEVQLAAVIRTCRQSSSLSEAGRKLFAVSRAQKTSRNDADRLRKYLGKFGLAWNDLLQPQEG